MASIMSANITLLSEQSLTAMMHIELLCHSAPWSEKTMSSCLSGRYRAFGLFTDGQLNAFYVLEKVGPDYTLMDICVAPNYQGQGFANQLMTHFIELVYQEQGENIFLEVRASNKAAIRLYEKFNFIESGIRKGYYPSEQGREDALLMILPVI